MAASQELCRKELSFLEQLPAMEVAVPAPVTEDVPTREIEENVMAAFAARQEEPAAEEPVEEPVEEPAPAVDDYPEGNPFEQKAPLDATRRIDLKDLKFGRNYTGE